VNDPIRRIMGRRTPTDRIGNRESNRWALLDGDCEMAFVRAEKIDARVAAGVPDFDIAIAIEARWRNAHRC
jgi:hypothetical protein